MSGAEIPLVNTGENSPKRRAKRPRGRPETSPELLAVEYVSACVRGLLRLVLVLVVVVAAAGGPLARAGVVRPKPMRLAPAGQVVLGSSFRAIRTGVGSTFASGDYLISTQGSCAYTCGEAPIVINDRLGTTARLDPRCDMDAFEQPWVVMSCPAGDVDQAGTGVPPDVEIYSLADGTRQIVTPNPLSCPPAPSGSADCGAAAVGSDWIEWVWGGYHDPTTFHFQNLQTGEFRDDPTNATTFPDLNSPSLAQTTCPGVRLIRREDPDGPAANPWGELTYEGQFALATTEVGRVFLERCGTHMRRLLPHGWSECCLASDLGSNATVIVWQSARNRLSGLFLPSLQKFTMPLPSAVVASEAQYETGFELALTSGALYMNEDGGALWRTASPAALPRNVSGPRVTHSRSTLTCVRGSWLNAAKFSFEWRVNGRKEKATKARLVLGKSPERRGVSCSVIASNPTGTATASSAPLYLR